jgi:hypothetical protein
MAKPLPITRFGALMTDSVYGPPRWMVERIWTTAPRDYFDSNRDHRRWNDRFAGKPIAESPGASRVRVVETPRGLKRWHVEIGVGAQPFSLSSHDDRDAAERDSQLLDPNIQFGPELRAQLEAMRGPGESTFDVIPRFVAAFAAERAKKPKRAKQ